MGHSQHTSVTGIEPSSSSSSYGNNNNTSARNSGSGEGKAGKEQSCLATFGGGAERSHAGTAGAGGHTGGQGGGGTGPSVEAFREQLHERILPLVVGLYK